MTLVWNTPLDIQSLEVSGELVAHVRIPGTVTLRTTGRIFGDIKAQHLIVEPGGVLQGNLRIGALESRL